MQIISNDKSVRSNIVQDSRDFNSHFLTTQAKRGEHLISLKPAIKKASDLMGDDIRELSTDNESLKNKKDSCDEKWLRESKAKLLKQIVDAKRANSIMSTMGN